MPIKTTNIEGVGLVNIVRKRGIRSMRLKVDNQGAIRLTLPWWVSAHIGLAFVLSKSDWINRQKIVIKFTPYDHMEFGKSLLLRIETATTKRPSKRFDNTTLTVRLPEDLSISDEKANLFISKSITWALRVQAEEMLLPRIRRLADEHGFRYKSCSVKQLKARWGSCNSQADIILNLYLIQLPWEIIDYVLLHELNHTKHLYHGPVFWHALETVSPRAKKMRKLLQTYQPRLYDDEFDVNS